METPLALKGQAFSSPLCILSLRGLEHHSPYGERITDVS